MAALFALAVLALPGCKSPFQAPAPPAPVRFYHDEHKDLELAEDERRLVRVLHSRLAEDGRAVPDLDYGLVAAARDLAGQVSRLDGDSDRGLRNETIQQALLDAGVTDARYFSHISAAPDLDYISERLAASASEHFATDGYSHFGIAVIRTGFPRTRTCVALFTQRIAHLQPFPKFLPDADDRSLIGRIEPGYDDPTLLVTQPDGVVRETPLILDEQREFLVNVPIDREQKGRYTVEVAVDSEAGPEMASIFPVDYLERPLAGTFLTSTTAAKDASARIVETEPPMSEADAERLLVELVNKERADRGLIQLATDDRLAALAKAHSEEMAKSGLFQHVSPTTGDLTDRAKAAGIPYRKIGENIALNTTIRAGHKSLLESPAHRINMLDPDYRYIGVGVVRLDEGGTQPQYAMTVHFADFR